MRSYGYWQRKQYSPSKPREVAGGIRAEATKGAKDKKWWSKRWIEALEQISDPSRLQRGRGYARSGQVISVEIESGSVKAKVQGSRARPYGVRIAMKAITEDGWTRLASRMTKDTKCVARLLAGEMPEDIEEVFRLEKLPLFPKTLGDLETDCTCPDWSNPCKHVAAVYYVLADEFDRDPFLLMKLRGKNRDELLSLLFADNSQLGAGASLMSGASTINGVEPTARPGVGLTPATEPLPADPALFWNGAGPIKPGIEAAGPGSRGAVLRELGPFPMWRGDDDLQDVLGRLYAAAAVRALETLSAGGQD